MNQVEGQQAFLTTLEDLLVREFRAYQSLVVLARAEREALASGDVEALEALLGRKENIMEEASRLERARQELIQAWAQAEGHASAALGDLLARLAGEPGARLRRLREGILALVGELKSLQRGNQAMAEGALERLEAVRAFLISLDGSSAGYAPLAPRPTMQPAVSLAPERWT